MKETRLGDKGIQVIGNNVFYGYYYKGSFGSEQFQVVDALYSATERRYKNFIKKYGL